MTLSPNNFNKDVPAEGGAFANSDPTQGQAFAKDAPPQAEDMFTGDNTGAGPYGGDFETFGTVYGHENYGSIVHFKERPTPPTIDHE